MSHAPPNPTLSPVIDRRLPYAQKLATRATSDIDLAVIHCTELPDLATAREFGERVHYDSGTGNSGHYYIDRDGRIERWVPEDHVAHHVRGWNTRSIGIELVHTGRWPDWYHSRRQVPTEPYPDVQIDALTALLRGLRESLPSLRWIAGHDDLDREQVAASDAPDQSVRRKIDPGPGFPWPRVVAASGLARLDPDSPLPFPAKSDE
ncbi:N-acetylmuramoyl-L-alanine amidase [Pseudofulvimonas gallinarii]|uniref:N-acetylmuramoyl-L-alanine amidase n=1 Tax=Pseudofulvimonas gallinarii TaxID=634155 RepID=A0A4V6RRE5_9GAMM|nr:N-acetylmuramoyl-L-alanine amidase [Pseudofulvimonas gallinarii]TCT01279.1 N-acetylmuramoyl-L-alanine amidase [Pseudofulvimonas gallinarii]THD15041.1 N-acetylmuramoyl-L-alanine amidase [Pseudofulvimonas gallinarii]